MDAVLEQQQQPETPAPLDKPKLLDWKKKRRGRVQQKDQAANIQRFVYDSILSLKQQCTDAETGQVTMDVKTAIAVHKLAGAWDSVADRLRILRGKGLPASTKPVAPKRVAEMKPID